MTLSGDQYQLLAGPYAATVTEQGAGLRELTHDGRPLILGYDADELVPAACGQLLIPWPNRVDRGRYAFRGRPHELAIDEPARDNAIHGLVRWASWRLAEREEHRVRLTHRLLGLPGFPFRLDLSAEYALDPADGLTVRLTAHNSGSGPAPYGHGAHPYLTLTRPLDECELELPAERYLPVDEREIPREPARDVAGTPYDFRRPRALAATRLDNAYTGLHRDAGGRAWLWLRDETRAVALWADETHPWLEIYTADEISGALRRAGLGAEPMTCPPNAFVSGTDLIELAPGADVTGSWGIVLRPGRPA